MTTNVKENPKTVITVTGKKINSNDACLIDKEYYEKNVDCVLVEIEKGISRWLPIFDTKIIFDFNSKKWILKSALDNSEGIQLFLIGFHNNNPLKKIFGADKITPLNVFVKSHYNESAKNIKNYEKEIVTLKENLSQKEESKQPVKLFNKFYTKYITFLSKLAYYRQIMEKEYDINTCETKDILKIISTVDNFITSDLEINTTFKDFNYCYRAYTDISLATTIEDSPLSKITFEVMENTKELKKAFDIYILYLGVLKILDSEIEDIRGRIKVLEKEIQKILKSGYFQCYCRTKEEAIALGFIDSNKSDYMYYRNNLTGDQYKDLKNSYPTFNENIYKSIKINYNASSSAESFNKIVKQYHDLEKYRKLTKDSYRIAKLLKGLSFGIEFETSCGRLREQDLSVLGVIPLKDGSIKGFEYTTIPYGMKDSNLKETDTRILAKDLVSLKKLCTELSDKTKINNSCSLHLHIGGARKDKLYLIALYMLSNMLQDEIFMTQPEFKKDAPKYLGSQKNYCQKLQDLNLFNNCIFDKSSILKEAYCDNVDLHFNNIFKFLSGGYDIGSKFNRKNHVHPYQRKWERTARYHWVNLVNCVFSDSGTIEFRLHAATVNFTKVLNWLLICAAIVKYAETHTKEIISGKISKITLDTVLLGYSNNFRDKKSVNAYGLFIYNYLSSYVESRKSYFKAETAKGKCLGEDDITKDSSFVYNFNEITSLI